MEYYVVWKQQGDAVSGRYRAAFFGIVMDCVVSEQQSVAPMGVAFWHRAVVMLYRYNVVYSLTNIKKAVSRSNCFSGNFIRWKFFEDPTFVNPNFFSGPVPLSRLKHHLDSSTEIPLWSFRGTIDTLGYRQATYYYRDPIEQSVRFFF
jgi:hypothetical protein